MNLRFDHYVVTLPTNNYLSIFELVKHKGNRDYYHQLQSRELYEAYKKAVWGGTGSIKDIFRRVIDTPTSRFFVTEERASIVISAMLKGKPQNKLSPTRKEMYEEIFRRVKAMMRVKPDSSLSDILRIVLAQPAPRFYITAGSAQVLIHRIKKDR